MENGAAQRSGGRRIRAEIAMHWLSRYDLMLFRMEAPLHRSLFLAGPAGSLEPLHGPVQSAGGDPPPLAAVVCHPHPLYSGTMHNKVVYQAAKSLHRFGLPVVRFNFRGVGLSEGAYDKGVGERGDV